MIETVQSEPGLAAIIVLCLIVIAVMTVDWLVKRWKERPDKPPPVVRYSEHAKRHHIYIHKRNGWWHTHCYCKPENWPYNITYSQEQALEYGLEHLREMEIG